MRYGSLFSGIGGFDLGLDRAGMECAWQVEIDPYCLKVLAKHWPDVRRYTDVREVGSRNLEPVDLVCGGFPCQPHSVAGKRRGAADDRDLWPEMRRVIAELKPRWVLAENVPGIRTTILDQALSDLENLGYSTGTLNIPACAFNAPHPRKRIFIVAYASGNLRGTSWDERSTTSDGCSKDVSDTNRSKQGRREQSQSRQAGRNAELAGDGEKGNATNAQLDSILHDKQHNLQDTNPNWNGWWSTEPGICGVAHGIPNRVDRLRSLGNAVVPQIVEWIGRQIMKAVDDD